MSWALLLGAIVAEVAGTLGMRASDGFRRRRWIVPVALLYLLAFSLLGLVLATGMPVGVAYGIWTAVGVAATAVLAHRIWGDPLSGLMALGIAFVVGGVLLVEIGS